MQMRRYPPSPVLLEYTQEQSHQNYQRPSQANLYRDAKRFNIKFMNAQLLQ